MKIIILAGKGESTTYLYNRLKDKHEIERVILEDAVPLKTFIQRRIKKLGLPKVINQLIFQTVVVKLLKMKYGGRKESLRISLNLSNEKIPDDIITNVPSVNDQEAIRLLQESDAKIVVVNGTRIISKKVLDAVQKIFINTHVGITPQYRGVHGAYWSLVNNDAENCGVTVHLIDSGIDTGDVLKQGIVRPEKQDSFVTYTLYQYDLGFKMIDQVLETMKDTDDLKTTKRENVSSKLYSHPTFTGYMYNFLFKGIK